MTSTDGLNSSGIKPTEYKILVEPKEIERTTKGGLILADETVEKESFGRQEGILIDASPDAFTWEDGVEWKRRPAIGQRVMYSRYNADQVQGQDGKTYWIMNDKSIMAVIEDVT